MRRDDIVHFLILGTLWEAEPAPDTETITEDNKIVVRKARLVRPVATLDKRTMRLLAADFAERVLPIYESSYPGDNRPRVAIEAARALAHGEITPNAAYAAAYAANAAANAAYAAAYAANAAYAAYAAYAANAAYAAYAAYAAANAANAAYAAAYAANAAYAPNVANAAAYAANAAERRWQTDRLCAMLGIEA
jgi:hypothetical protein